MPKFSNLNANLGVKPYFLISLFQSIIGSFFFVYYDIKNLNPIKGFKFYYFSSLSNTKLDSHYINISSPSWLKNIILFCLNLKISLTKKISYKLLS
ncbi:unnamed protein product [Blepharisma stoltei]|uniref:Uncharacterized protein n=1 Tax=Blepharisma stoltei TaxID=1481888 RepID=A0AAU9K7R9_9CILI|nr:unnamed protein product [Blepharisma stoltei]